MMAGGVSQEPVGPGMAGEGATPGLEPAKPGRFSPDVVAGLVIVLLCFAVWAVTTTFEDLSIVVTQGMGPAAFPRLVLGVIAVLALWLAWTTSSRTQPECEAVHPMVYATMGGIVAVMGAMALFGIHGAVLASCVGMGRLWGERRWLVLAAVAIGFSIAIELAFVRGFGIGLPRGLLQTWLT